MALCYEQCTDKSWLQEDDIVYLHESGEPRVSVMKMNPHRYTKIILVVVQTLKRLVTWQRVSSNVGRATLLSLHEFLMFERYYKCEDRLKKGKKSPVARDIIMVCRFWSIHIIYTE